MWQLIDRTRRAMFLFKIASIKHISHKKKFYPVIRFAAKTY